tara:strand:+ start:1819 stop:2094 length:276 start_codon:yes stop_codon:yes gene_type:complete
MEIPALELTEQASRLVFLYKRSFPDAFKKIEHMFDQKDIFDLLSEEIRKDIEQLALSKIMNHGAPLPERTESDNQAVRTISMFHRVLINEA